MWSSWIQTGHNGIQVIRHGWLKELGSLDFAGGAAVHITSGTSAFVSTFSLFSNRQQTFKDPKEKDTTNILLGTALMWFGWFGFNSGSALKSNYVASLAFFNTHVAASSGLLTWAILDSIFKKQISIKGICCGVVVSLVAITPASGYIHVLSAMFFGFFPTCIVYIIRSLKKRYDGCYKKYFSEDQLSVFEAHGIPSIVGCILLGFFASKDVNIDVVENGIFFGGDGYLLGVQILAVTVTSLLSMFMTLIFLIFLEKIECSKLPENSHIDVRGDSDEDKRLVNTATVMDDK